MSSKMVAQSSLQHPISPRPCEVSVAGSSCSSENRAVAASARERPGRTCGADARPRRLNDAIDLLKTHVLPHHLCICGARTPPCSRCSSTTGARPRRSCNRDDDVARRSAPTCACDSAGPRWSTAPRFAIHRSAATIFRRVCVIVIQMQRMRRERRFLLECPRSCCRYGGRCRSEEEDPSQAARRSRFRAALPPRGRWQEVA